MRTTFDPTKREATLRERCIDFADASRVFLGKTFEVEDTRKAYGEQRMICYGYLAMRLVVIVYAPRGAVRHIISMRKANEREIKKISPILGN